MSARDIRLRSMGEGVNNISAIKLNSWVDLFIERVQGARDDEV